MPVTATGVVLEEVEERPKNLPKKAELGRCTYILKAEQLKQCLFQPPGSYLRRRWRKDPKTLRLKGLNLTSKQTNLTKKIFSKDYFSHRGRT